MTENKVFCGDAAEILKYLPQGSANMCVTSPPYYGLRDYGIENQIGTEQTPQEYVDRLTKVFDEVYRVLMESATVTQGAGKGKDFCRKITSRTDRFMTRKVRCFQCRTGGKTSNKKT